MKSPLLNSLLVLLQFVIVSLTDDQQIDRRTTSNVCRDTTDCPQNSVCEPRGGGVNYMEMEGQCVCIHGYFMKASSDRKASGKSYTRKCIQIADFGELCYLNEQCEFRLGHESYCYNRQCSCRPGTHYVVEENGCFNSSKIGDYCRLTSNCAIDKTKCQQGQCRCFFGYHPSFDKSRCLKSVNLNESCYSDEECVVENSHCLNRVCQCKPGFAFSGDGLSCLPLAASLNQPCQQDSQCSGIPHSQCGENSTCICIDDYHDINSRCWSSVRLNGICESDENCVIDHSSCRNKHCVCDEGFLEASQGNRGSKYCSNAETVQISFLVALVFIISLTRLL